MKLTRNEGRFITTQGDDGQFLAGLVGTRSRSLISLSDTALKSARAGIAMHPSGNDLDDLVDSVLVSLARVAVCCLLRLSNRPSGH